MLLFLRFCFFFFEKGNIYEGSRGFWRSRVGPALAAKLGVPVQNFAGSLKEHPEPHASTGVNAKPTQSQPTPAAQTLDRHTHTLKFNTLMYGDLHKHA